MGFNKCYVQSLEDVKRQYEQLGEEEFKQLYIRRDVLIGPDDAINFILEKLNPKKDDAIK